MSRSPWPSESMMRISRRSGTPSIGVYSRVSESYAFIASDLDGGFADEVALALGVECVRTSVAGSFVVGSLMAANSNGAVVSGLAEQTELDRIGKVLNVATLEDRFNAAGNNILVNDFGAIVNPELSDTEIKLISDALGVECVRGTIAEIPTVGAVCLATNKGAAVHPGATSEDLALIKDVLKVDAIRTTLNHGVRTVSACALANSKGALVGDLTTPIEMGKLEDALDLF